MRRAKPSRLPSIDGRLVDMAQRAGAAMDQATRALLDADLALAEAVITADAELDELAALVESDVFELISQEHPVAAELRALLSGVRISGLLERMGDLAVHVAKAARLRYPGSAVPAELRGVIVDMGAVAHKMVEETVVALTQRDVEAADRLQAMDREMDRLHREMFTIALSPAWSHGTETAIDITLISRFYERFADHAVTISKRVVHVVTGEPYMSRHYTRPGTTPPTA